MVVHTNFYSSTQFQNKEAIFNTKCTRALIGRGRGRGTDLNAGFVRGTEEERAALREELHILVSEVLHVLQHNHLADVVLRVRHRQRAHILREKDRERMSV